MSDHYSLWEWASYQLSCGDQQRNREIAAHLNSGCADCSDLARIVALLSDTLHSNRHRAPEHCREQAMRLPRLQPLWERRATARSSSVAPGIALLFDSFASAAPAGVRGLRNQRHCVYTLSRPSLPGATLEVMVEQTGSRDEWCVMGQILNVHGHGVADCRVQLSQAQGNWLRHTTNQDGEFALLNARGSDWTLELQGPDCGWTIHPVLTPKTVPAGPLCGATRIGGQGSIGDTKAMHSQDDSGQTDQR